MFQYFYIKDFKACTYPGIVWMGMEMGGGGGGGGNCTETDLRGQELVELSPPGNVQ